MKYGKYRMSIVDFRIENANLRGALDAAEQRAERAEKERDEARKMFVEWDSKGWDLATQLGAHLADAVRLLEQVDRIESSGMPGGLDTSPIKKFLSSTPSNSLARLRAMERVIEMVKSYYQMGELPNDVEEAYAEYDRLEEKS